jgi:DNA (cytosine-5)-methyltransferase 1
VAAYYNEIDPYAAQWLRNLIAAGHIAPGDVDERDIQDVLPSDLDGYTQCHFFAGVGVWSYALRNAGWPDDRPVWTGSCPCQPFSSAGKGAAFADERHLWPAWHHLIRQRRPGTVFGEQVASSDGLAWLDLVQADMEGEDYACGPVDLCSAGVGAPHIRQRLFWVANSNGSSGGEGRPDVRGRIAGGDAEPRPGPGRRRMPRRLADHDQHGCGSLPGERQHGQEHDAKPCGGFDSHGQPGPTNGLWRDADWLFCRDGKWRPVEPGTFPLAHGAPARMGRLRAYGNAINAEAAEAVKRLGARTEYQTNPSAPSCCRRNSGNWEFSRPAIGHQKNWPPMAVR